MFITPSFKKSLIVEQFQGNYLKVARNSFMARANWVLINKPNLARAVDAHAQMLILSCQNFGVFITLIAHISASARWIFFIFSVITRIN